MPLNFDNVDIDDLTFDGVSINTLNMDGVAVWSRTSVPVSLSNEDDTSQSASTLGSDYYNNNDGVSLTSTSKSFVGNFSGDPTSYRNDGYSSGSNDVTVTPTFDGNTGSASVVFSLADNVGTGVYVKTYTFKVYAINADGESTTFSTWQVTNTFTVNQGVVPQINSSYGVTWDTNRTSTTNYGVTDTEQINGEWSVRFVDGDAPTTSYSKESSGILDDNSKVTLSEESFNSSTGDSEILHILSSSSSVGSYYFRSFENAYAYNKYGRSALATWRVSTSFTVQAVVPVKLSNESSTNAGTRSTLGSSQFNYNDGASSLTSTSKSFVGNFSGNPTSYSNSGSSSGSSNITATPSFNSNGTASVRFTFSSSARVGSYSKTYTFRVYARNSAGTSSSYSTWSVTAYFNVSQGTVPTISSSYGDPLTSYNGTVTGTTKYRTGTWNVRFNNATSYTRDWSGKHSGSNYVTLAIDPLVGYNTGHRHTISGAPAGDHTFTSREVVTGSNKYGSVQATWYINTIFRVS